MPNADPLRPGKLPRPRVGMFAGRPPFASELFNRKLAAHLRLVVESAAKGRNRKPGRGMPESDACPVAPDRPLNLSGGAAAPLEFDA